MTIVGRIAKVVSFAVVVALLTIFAKPLWQSARSLLNADSQTLKRFNRVTANNAPANSTLVPATSIAAVPAAEPTPQVRKASKRRSHRTPGRSVKNRVVQFGG